VRQRDRGYNQADLLATALARSTRLGVWPALVRRRPTERQHGLDRMTRLRNLRHAMAFRAPAPTPAGDGSLPSSVILLDDVLTTGATFEACAVILREAGIETVYGFAIAREV
jgi:predicted amidophosphoribosyltransferase